MRKIDRMLNDMRRLRACADGKFITAMIIPSENNCRVNFSVWYTDSDQYEFNTTVYPDAATAREYVDKRIAALQDVNEPIIFEMDYGFDGYED